MQSEAETRLAHFERMQAFANLVGSVAHDFNNLLVGVVCNAEMLQQYHPQTDAGLKCVDGILNTSEIVQSITTRMLTFGGKRSTESESVDLNTVVKTCVERLREEIEGVELEVTNADSTVSAEADPNLIEQALRQLVLNAIESGSEQERVQIRLGIEQKIRTLDDGKLFGGAFGNHEAFGVVEVIDNGSGFSEPDVARLFEPFQSTKRGRARGLGLAIAYSNIVFQHEGFIRVETSGEGTKVSLLIPSEDAD